MTPAAFKGTYSDFKLIKTRGVVSISFEIPVEQAQAALDVLGGMPVAATEVWCAVARLAPKADTACWSNETEVVQPVEAERPSRTIITDTPSRQKVTQPSGGTKKTWRDKTFAEQAGILCNDVKFCRFMMEERPGTMHDAKGDVVEAVRMSCGVTSRSKIAPGTMAGASWQALERRYRLWADCLEPAS